MPWAPRSHCYDWAGDLQDPKDAQLPLFFFGGDPCLGGINRRWPVPIHGCFHAKFRQVTLAFTVLGSLIPACCFGGDSAVWGHPGRWTRGWADGQSKEPRVACKV